MFIFNNDVKILNPCSPFLQSFLIGFKIYGVCLVLVIFVDDVYK